MPVTASGNQPLNREFQFKPLKPGDGPVQLRFDGGVEIERSCIQKQQIRRSESRSWQRLPRGHRRRVGPHGARGGDVGPGDLWVALGVFAFSQNAD